MCQRGPLFSFRAEAVHPAVSAYESTISSVRVPNGPPVSFGLTEGFTGFVAKRFSCSLPRLLDIVFGPLPEYLWCGTEFVSHELDHSEERCRSVNSPCDSTVQAGA